MLGRFSNEIDASNVYQSKLKEIINNLNKVKEIKALELSDIDIDTLNNVKSDVVITRTLLNEDLKEDADELAAYVARYYTGDKVVNAIEKYIKRANNNDLAKAVVGLVEGSSLTPKELNDIKNNYKIDGA